MVVPACCSVRPPCLTAKGCKRGSCPCCQLRGLPRASGGRGEAVHTAPSRRLPRPRRPLPLSRSACAAAPPAALPSITTSPSPATTM